ncbi:T-complex protein 1 subunit theta [Cimex lectularius]|uniref:T-complex protein 1 subunit theta n=1 Tax=Cimex lectularius TaxID=79782 RepID=A0A8I6RR66_CIMLE|nr:T-complex protein 1 subunit theta [Cimex lectularius]
MAMHVPKPPGFAQMLKEGARRFSGLEEAVYRNIKACKEFTETVKTAYGPNGMNKIVINHIDKLFVTNDAATIVNELEVEHPAAKIMVLASQMQDEEVGDGTNFVLIFAGSLLEVALPLLKMGMTPVSIIEGYDLALNKALEVLEKMVCHEIKDCRDEENVTKAIRSAVMSKQLGFEDFLAKLITKACISIMPEETTFNVDNIRICKILGSSVLNSEAVLGMVFKRQVEGEVTKKTDAKIAIYTCPVDVTITETKGTVLIKSADELMKFSKGEENLLEKQIEAIKAAGVDIIVGGGKFGDMALHFINKAGMMAVRLNSKFDIRRLCKATGATALPVLAPPTKDDLGFADNVFIDEIGETSVVIFRLEGKESKISTIIIRGATDNYMNDVERAVDDGVNTFKSLSRDGRVVPGACAVESQIARHVRDYADEVPGTSRLAVIAFSQALMEFPKVLAKNSGIKSKEVMAEMFKVHKTDEGRNKGINIDMENENNLIDSNKEGIWDLYNLKCWGLKFATSAAKTILRVDEIIMAKRAGGPAPKGPKGNDEDD